MSNGNSELFTFLGASFGTLGALFGAQILYGACIDLKFHADKNNAPQSAEAVAAFQEQQQKVASAKLPLDQAKGLLAQRGRDGVGSVAARPSDDLSALSGWIRRPGFQAAIAHPIRSPRVITPEPVVAPVPEPEATPAPVVPAHPVPVRRIAAPKPH